MPNKVIMTKFHDANELNLCTVEAEAELGRLIYDDDIGAYVNGPEGYKAELTAIIPEPALYAGGQIDNNIDGNYVLVSIRVTDPDGNQTVYVPGVGLDNEIIWTEES